MTIEKQLADLTMAIEKLTVTLPSLYQTIAATTSRLANANLTVSAEEPTKTVAPKVTKAKAEVKAVETVSAPPAEQPASVGNVMPAGPTMEDAVAVATKLVELKLGDRLVELLNNVSGGTVTKVKLLPANMLGGFVVGAKMAIAEAEKAAAAQPDEDPLA